MPILCKYVDMLKAQPFLVIITAIVTLTQPQDILFTLAQGTLKYFSSLNQVHMDLSATITTLLPLELSSAMEDSHSSTMKICDFLTLFLCLTNPSQLFASCPLRVSP